MSGTSPLTPFLIPHRGTNLEKVMSILNTASRTAHKAKLATKNTQAFSAYPVFDSEFWEAIYKAAKSPRTAQDVLDAMQIIESEPCIENDRVWNCVNTARHHAKIALLN
jgi:hypothetical protein